jgi:hypothetical protein
VEQGLTGRKGAVSGWTPFLGVGLACLLGAAFFMTNRGPVGSSPSPLVTTFSHTTSPDPNSVARSTVTLSVATNQPASSPTIFRDPAATEGPTHTPSSAPMSVFSVAVDSPDGYAFVALRPGNYLFRYAGGAYSTYPLGVTPPGPSWLTSACANSPGEVPWTNGKIPAAGPHCSFVVGWSGAFYPSSSAAVVAAKQMATQSTPPTYFAPPAVSLAEGNIIVFRAVDDEAYNAYAGNQGSLAISVYLLS